VRRHDAGCLQRHRSDGRRRPLIDGPRRRCDASVAVLDDTIGDDISGDD
jgi:hypothetical protein